MGDVRRRDDLEGHGLVRGLRAGQGLPLVAARPVAEYPRRIARYRPARDVLADGELAAREVGDVARGVGVAPVLRAEVEELEPGLELGEVRRLVPDEEGLQLAGGEEPGELGGDRGAAGVVGGKGKGRQGLWEDRSVAPDHQHLGWHELCEQPGHVDHPLDVGDGNAGGEREDLALAGRLVAIFDVDLHLQWQLRDRLRIPEVVAEEVAVRIARDVLEIPIGDVRRVGRRSPGDVLVVPLHHARSAGEADAGDVRVAAPVFRVDVQLVEGRRAAEAQVRIVRQDRVAGVGDRAVDYPLVRTEDAALANGAHGGLPHQLGDEFTRLLDRLLAWPRLRAGRRRAPADHRVPGTAAWPRSPWWPPLPAWSSAAQQPPRAGSVFRWHRAR